MVVQDVNTTIGGLGVRILITNKRKHAETILIRFYKW